jgi:transcriptional regulator with XRE-family HTH domain
MAREGPSRNSTALLVKLLRKVLLACTQRELSERSGIDEDLISRYERGTVLQPTPRNLERLLRSAGVLEIQQPLLLALDQLSDLLSPRPPAKASSADPLQLRDLVDQTSRRLALLQPDALAGEPAHPARIHTVALLVQFLRKVLLGCSLHKLALGTGIHENVLARYEAGKVERPSPKNLDRILAAAGVLHLKTPLLQAMSDLAAVLARQPRPAEKVSTPQSLLTSEQIDGLIAFSLELLRRTREDLGLRQE